MRPVKNIPDYILAESRNMLGMFPLCDSCLGRMHAKRLCIISSGNLGFQIKSRIRYNTTEKCYICRDLFGDLDSYVNQMLLMSAEIHYSSFLVGAILRPSVMDRDDHVRSRFKLKGSGGIKAEITHLLSKSFARRSGRPANNLDPDLTFLVNFRTKTCNWRTKSLLVSGRYTKGTRGLPQKQEPCGDCRGSGCIFCNNHGITSFDSVEGVISRMFYDKLGTVRVRFTWIGGEDRDSLVGGDGRPFFARLASPKSRNSRLPRIIDLDGVSVHGLKRIRRIPITPTGFRSKIRLHVKTGDTIPPRLLPRLYGMTERPIVVSDGDRRVGRTIHELTYKKTSPDGFSVRMVADGGISVKKLVEGGSEPNMSQVLGMDCTCVRFDFEDVMTNDTL